MKIASIDIGTNAIKSKIFKTTPASIEFIKGIRSPIRLGSDVFKNGNLSQGKLNQVIETIREYEEVFKENSISHYEIVATSAFRDTANSEDARRYIETAINHPLRVISGLEEAKLIRFHPKSNTGKNKIFVDLGGGSTEFFIRNEQETIIRSFQLGAVRNMLQKDNREEWQRLEEWLESIKPKKKLIGIGGNIRSFLNAHESKEMSLNEFKNKVKKLSKLSTKEKIKKYSFSPDRADVIDHALDIFQFISEHLGVQKIASTKWGISDSIAIKLFHELYSSKVTIS
jgi:exopolyphosphatase/guanosine-5'-triphosphate,3'-diphosphate pyrophosphatase|tara:strand:- start:2707 stop:3561 length:855 start_codon:yes stop_codon:yes gene_type:complete